MKQIQKVIISTLISLSVLFSTTTPVFAENLNGQNNQISQLKKELTTLQEEISKIVAETKEVKQNLETTKTEIEKLQAEIKEKEGEIATLETSIAKRIDILKERATALQQQNRTNIVVKVLLSSENISDFIQNVTSLNAILQSDTDILEKIAEEKAQVEKDKEAVQQKEQDLQHKKENLEQQQATLKEKETEKDKAVQTLQEKLDVAIADNNSRSGSNHPLVITPPPFTSGFAWPAVNGRITSYQGNRWGSFHRGIDIAGVSNRAILASKDGTVVYAAWQGTYGQVVKISHANGFQTLYAHLDAIHVSVGQTVSQGSQIGIMGNTGRSTGTHLHFEVSYNGQLLNPVAVLGR